MTASVSARRIAMKRVCRYLMGSPAYRSAHEADFADALYEVDVQELLSQPVWVGNRRTSAG